MTKNLWGDLSDMAKVRTPRMVLSEQGSQLSELTGGALTVAIDDRGSGQGNFRYDFDIVAPALNNYIYTVLTITHSVSLYPVTMAVGTASTELPDESALEKKLASVLQSKDTRNVIAALMSQST